MGLDMYLTSSNVGSYVDNELVYWRKANMIHGWFHRKFNGVENGKYYPCTVEILRELLATCKEVLTYRNDVDKLKHILPPMQGFFFGSYEYDEYYFNSVEYTIEQLEKLLSTTPLPESIYYLADW